MLSYGVKKVVENECYLRLKTHFLEGKGTFCNRRGRAVRSLAFE